MAKNELAPLKGHVILFGLLAVVSLIVLAFIQQLMQTGMVNNTTANYFSAAVAIFGSFASVLAIVIMGKAAINLLKGGL